MAVTYTLQILHQSDGEAGLLAPDTAPNLAALVDAFEDDYGNTLVLSGGDNFLPGPFGAAGTDPSINAVLGTTGTPAFFRPDIAIQNAIGVEVSSIGNHEFDLGSNVYNAALTAQGGFVGANFALVSANLNFAADADLRGRADQSLGGTAGNDFAGDEASTIKGRITPWTTVTEGGERIGILGATTQVLESISSPSGTEVLGSPGAGQPGDNQEVDNIDLLAAQLQPIIDQMIASGINKIILQSHLQDINNEKLLATKLQGVDIILSAGSNTRLGDADDVAATFPGHEASFEDTYPIVTAGTDGKTTLIVNTDGEYTYLGRLVVGFDANGDIELSSLDPAINGAYASTTENVAAAWGDTDGDLSDTAFAEGTRGNTVADITGAVEQVLIQKDGTSFGFTDVYLEAERGVVRSQETNLGNLTADANAFAAREALGGTAPFLVSLKNGGGIRAQIGAISSTGGDPVKLPPLANPDADKPAGAISQLDIENSLRFDNKMMVFDATPQELLNIFEFAAGVPNNNGGFPQIGGLKYSYDEGAAVGSRIQSLALTDEDGNVIAKIVDGGELVAGAPETISVVVLNFTANGGDGYPIKANGSNFRYILNDGTLSAAVDESLDFAAVANVPTNALGEQQALQEYLAANFATPDTAFDEADTPEALDTRIQNLDLRDDTVFQNEAVIGGDGDDSFVDTIADDIFDGAGGTDTVTFAGNFGAYEAGDLGSRVQVAGGGGDNTLINVERLVFADGTIDLDDGDALFDTLYYYSQNPDVFAAGFDALAHYQQFGEAEGRDPNAVFDVSGYLALNPDVAGSDFSALEHYRQFGAAEGREIGLGFDAGVYLARNADVAASGFDALEHYLQFGKAEGREAPEAVGNTIAADGFDADWYLLSNPDVAASGFGARAHYDAFGEAEGRDPNSYFDTSFYLASNPDVAASGFDPLAHYSLFGFEEGRDPSEEFDTSDYLAANADVDAANVNPLTHYLQFGVYEGRSIGEDSLVA